MMYRESFSYPPYHQRGRAWRTMKSQVREQGWYSCSSTQWPLPIKCCCSNPLFFPKHKQTICSVTFFTDSWAYFFTHLWVQINEMTTDWNQWQLLICKQKQGMRSREQYSCFILIEEWFYVRNTQYSQQIKNNEVNWYQWYFFCLLSLCKSISSHKLTGLIDTYAIIPH